MVLCLGCSHLPMSLLTGLYLPDVAPTETPYFGSSLFVFDLPDSQFVGRGFSYLDLQEFNGG